MSTKPARTDGPSTSWRHRKLYDRVVDALHALPWRFQSSLVISGIPATDLFTLNTPLGAAIEASVVDNLNTLRELWDPDEHYAIYSFVRQTQVFPDVRLQTTAPGVPEEDRVIMGIELKGWFILAKEGEPSFRYKVAPSVCAEQDLLAINPWSLSEVVSGTPRLLEPLVDEARYAAEYRNYYWTESRGRKGANAAVKPAEVNHPYPYKGQKFNEEAERDSGRNFGRVARGGYMTDFVERVMTLPISGIPAKNWQEFLSIFAEGATEEQIAAKLSAMRKQAKADGAQASTIAALRGLENALRDLIREER